MKKNKKSDFEAKATYKRYLEEQGFTDVKIIGSPSDIVAFKNNEKYYFEIKMTKQIDKYFGAATITEWKTALSNPNNFKFVIAATNDDEKRYNFKEYSPEEFMKYSTVPPFKVNFNVNLKDDSKVSNRRKAIQASEKILLKIIKIFEELSVNHAP